MFSINPDQPSPPLRPQIITLHLQLHSVPHIIRTRMEEIALRRNIQVRNHADLRVIDIHNRKLRRTCPIGPQPWVINRPVRLIEAIIRVGVGVRIRNERDEPVLHVLGDGGVVDACEVLSLAVESHIGDKGMLYLTR